MEKCEVGGRDGDGDTVYGDALGMGIGTESRGWGEDANHHHISFPFSCLPRTTREIEP